VLDGARANCQIPDRMFGEIFFTSLTKDRVANYAWIWMLFSPSVRGLCIIGDAILPQSGKNLTKKCGPEFGGLLWHHLTPNRKKAI